MARNKGKEKGRDFLTCLKVYILKKKKKEAHFLLLDH